MKAWPVLFSFRSEPFPSIASKRVRAAHACVSTGVVAKLDKEGSDSETDSGKSNMKPAAQAEHMGRNAKPSVSVQSIQAPAGSQTHDPVVP